MAGVSVQFLSIARFAANNLVNIAGHFKKTQNRAILEAVINIVLSVAFAFRSAYTEYCSEQ